MQRRPTLMNFGPGISVWFTRAFSRKETERPVYAAAFTVPRPRAASGEMPELLRFFIFQNVLNQVGVDQGQVDVTLVFATVPSSVRADMSLNY